MPDAGGGTSRGDSRAVDLQIEDPGVGEEDVAAASMEAAS